MRSVSATERVRMVFSAWVPALQDQLRRVGVTNVRQ